MKRILVLLLLMSIFISACGAGEATEPAIRMEELMTASVGTMVSIYFETQTAMYTPATSTPTVTSTPAYTMTPYPTISEPSSTPTFAVNSLPVFTFTPGIPTVTGTLPTATVNANALAFGCSNLAFIRDVNYPPDSVLQKGEEVTKTWKVQNTGSCNWTFQFHLVQFAGDDMKASGDYIGKTVTVLDWAEVSVGFAAPKKAGSYKAYFRMVDAGGNMFGSTLVLSFTVKD